jgi:hypothetical protein
MLYDILGGLPEMAARRGGSQVTGAAVCLLDSDGEAKLAVLEGRELVPTGLMVALAMVYAALDGDQDPRTRPILDKAVGLLAYAIQLKRGDLLSSQSIQ